MDDRDPVIGDEIPDEEGILLEPNDLSDADDDAGEDDDMEDTEE